MKKQMREIEIKIRVSNFDSVIAALASRGCSLSDPITQVDTNYLTKGTKYTDIVPGVRVLRIRQEKNRVLFTIKYRSQTVELAKVEQEVEVSDAKKLAEMLEMIGYESALEIRKTRQKIHYKDYEICLDEVEGLGKFIEIEKKSDGDGEEVQKELLNTLVSLGLSSKDKEERGYDTLLVQMKK